MKRPFGTIPHPRWKSTHCIDCLGPTSFVVEQKFRAASYSPGQFRRHLSHNLGREVRRREICAQAAQRGVPIAPTPQTGFEFGMTLGLPLSYERSVNMFLLGTV